MAAKISASPPELLSIAMASSHDIDKKPYYVLFSATFIDKNPQSKKALEFLPNDIFAEGDTIVYMYYRANLEKADSIEKITKAKKAILKEIDAALKINKDGKEL
jgi:hypothetical protein